MQEEQQQQGYPNAVAMQEDSRSLLAEATNPAKIIEEFSELFDNAVKRQLFSDVEVGSTLSGGFDSSSISVFASKTVDKKLSVLDGG